jgi:hypothetical protein
MDKIKWGCVSKDLIFDVIDEVFSSGVSVFGVEFPFDSFFVLSHVFELFFGGVFHSFVLVFEEVFEVGVSFFDLGFDSLLGEFFEFFLDLLDGIVFDFLLLGQVLFLDLEDFLPGFGLALGAIGVTGSEGLTGSGIGWFGHLFHSLFNVVVHESLLVVFSLACLDEFSVFIRSTEMVFVEQAVVAEIGTEELIGGILGEGLFRLLGFDRLIDRLWIF